MMRFPSVFLPLFLLVLLGAPASAGAAWSGNWDTTYGQLRLMQDGRRVYGDYAARGTIEGTVSEAGDELRAVFMYTDGRWGLVRWTRAGNRISGLWNWSASGIPSKGAGTRWDGKRTSRSADRLRYAGSGRIALPEGDPQFVENDFGAWLRFAGAQACCGPTGGAGPEKGRWHRGYDNTLTQPVVNLGIDVTHNAGARTGAASLSIYVPPGGVCARDVNPGFCKELQRLRGTDGYVSARVTGQRIVPHDNLEQFLIAFRLPGDREDRLLAIQEGLKHSTLRIWSRSRGLDLTDVAGSRKHLCDMAACSNQVERDLAANPDSYLGTLADMRWAQGLMAAGDASGRPGPDGRRDPPRGAPAGGNGGWQAGVFGILDEQGKPLGTIRFQRTGRGLAATGDLAGLFRNGASGETTFLFVSGTDEAVSFNVTLHSAQSGGRRDGRLIVERPGPSVSRPRGTIVLDDEIILVQLDPARSGSSPYDGQGQMPGQEASGPDEMEGDQPGFGIYKYTYRFRGVPSGRSVRLRDGPSRKSRQTAMLAADTINMQIRTCDREIDNIRFEEASRSEQLETLSRHWCEIITTDGETGWLPARYLSPEQN
jgi:hypothetical protein